MMTRAFVLLVLGAATVAAQQQQGGGNPLRVDDVATYARVHVAIVAARDSANARLARPANKTAKAQREHQDSLRAQIAEILHHGGMTDAEYQRRTFLVSSDTVTRRIYDSVVVVLTGTPLPGQVVRGMTFQLPPGRAGVHVGHVLNGYEDTPGLQGLLPVAMAEARVATQHATLATRQPENLQYMKTHSEHVMHALDPSTVPQLMAPGQGYGLKKAVAAISEHIELAAKESDATANVVAHARHVVMSVKNTQSRADQMLALAAQVLTATLPAEAAKLVSQLASLGEQLAAGADANGDGRITFELNEGGMQHVDQHVKFMLPPRP
ncbi:MAG: hypothetical protein WD801_07235 [Gemmatimonadaceae bacterium]